MPLASSAPLGELETLLILAVLHLTEQRQEAYGSAIRDEIHRRAQRRVPRGSIYVTLDRLEEKGLLVARDGGTSASRGHRPKRVFRVTPAGIRAARAAVAAVTRMQRGLQDVLGRV
jgi:DNA-binding PadR family transcriptional regulator